MSKIPLSYLISLVRFDQSMHAYQQQQNMLQQDFIACDAHLQTLQQEISDHQHNYLKHKNFVHNLEKKIDELSAQHRLVEKKMATTVNFKEYSALEQQRNAIVDQQSIVEPQLEAAWQKQEELTDTLPLIKKANQEQHSSTQKALHNVAKRIELLTETLRQASLQRPDLCSAVPKELLTQYTSLQEKVKDPVIPLKNNICSGCFYIIPPQKINNIFLYNLEQCSNCFRLLYAPHIV